ncbi:MAG: hypothetical protein DI528_12310 [Shinella sp.]|nr:MAG: hypothetical protein DI528_12310 [Shinella sp.]
MPQLPFSPFTGRRCRQADEGRKLIGKRGRRNGFPLCFQPPSPPFVPGRWRHVTMAPLLHRIHCEASRREATGARCGDKTQEPDRGFVELDPLAEKATCRCGTKAGGSR